MIGLMGLCDSIINPAGRAYKKTKRKSQKNRNGGKQMAPPYSPLWYEIPRRMVYHVVLLKKGIRCKLCSKCKKWKGADTLNFSIDKNIRIGISSQCRDCKRKSERK